MGVANFNVYLKLIQNKQEGHYVSRICTCQYNRTERGKTG